jgi:lipoprotein-anchoring transpeptidase ErfK/SrfK
MEDKMKDKLGTLLVTLFVLLLLAINAIVMGKSGVAILNTLNQPVRVVEITPAAPSGVFKTEAEEKPEIVADSQFIPEFYEHQYDIPDKLVGTEDVWVEVDLTEQALYMHDGERLYAGFRISSGAPGKDTPAGLFKIYAMYDSYPTWGSDYHYVVPWAMWFHHEFGIHGAYWHDDFGTPVSHGCVNMNVNDAQWIYGQVERGTYVWVHE